jgi:hypothetical protein
MIPDGSSRMSIATTSLPVVLDHVQSDLALTDDELAGVLGLAPAQLARARTNADRLPSSAADRLDQLMALNERLQGSFQPEGVVIWLRSGSRYLGGQTLLSALHEGHFDWANAALDAFDAGIFL